LQSLIGHQFCGKCLQQRGLELVRQPTGQSEADNNRVSAGHKSATHVCWGYALLRAKPHCAIEAIAVYRRSR